MILSHIVFTSFPTGLTDPRPVITTLRSVIIKSLLKRSFFYFPHFKAIAPHVRPPPNPTKTIKSSYLILPLFAASDKAIGIDAEELLPYFLMVVAILSSEIPSRLRAASIILILA